MREQIALAHGSVQKSGLTFLVGEETVLEIPGAQIKKVDSTLLVCGQLGATCMQKLRLAKSRLAVGNNISLPLYMHAGDLGPLAHTDNIVNRSLFSGGAKPA